MSRCGTPYDNVMMDNFFLFLLIVLCIYCHKPSSFCEAKAMIDCYIDFYEKKHIQMKFGVALHLLRHSA